MNKVKLLLACIIIILSFSCEKDSDNDSQEIDLSTISVNFDIDEKSKFIWDEDSNSYQITQTIYLDSSNKNSKKEYEWSGKFDSSQFIPEMTDSRIKLHPTIYFIYHIHDQNGEYVGTVCYVSYYIPLLDINTAPELTDCP